MNTINPYKNFTLREIRWLVGGPRDPRIAWRSSKTEEELDGVNDKISKTLKEYNSNPSNSERLKEQGAKISKALIGRILDEGHIVGISRAMEEKWLDSRYRESVIGSLTGRILSEEHKRNMSLTCGSGWYDWWASLTDKEQEVISKKLAGRTWRGSGYLLEQTLLSNILEEAFPRYWLQNGGQPNSVLVAGLEPDFLSRNGDKKIIEYFEMWWHSPFSDEEGTKRRRYLEAGYDLLVVWASDFWTKDISWTINLIKEFMGKIPK